MLVNPTLSLPANARLEAGVLNFKGLRPFPADASLQLVAIQAASPAALATVTWLPARRRGQRDGARRDRHQGCCAKDNSYVLSSAQLNALGAEIVKRMGANGLAPTSTSVFISQRIEVKPQGVVGDDAKSSTTSNALTVNFEFILANAGLNTSTGPGVVAGPSDPPRDADGRPARRRPETSRRLDGTGRNPMAMSGLVRGGERARAERGQPGRSRLALPHRFPPRSPGRPRTISRLANPGGRPQPGTHDQPEHPDHQPAPAKKSHGCSARMDPAVPASAPAPPRGL